MGSETSDPEGFVGHGGTPGDAIESQWSTRHPAWHPSPPATHAGGETRVDRLEQRDRTDAVGGPEADGRDTGIRPPSKWAPTGTEVARRGDAVPERMTRDAGLVVGPVNRTKPAESGGSDASPAGDDGDGFVGYRRCSR